MHPYILRSNNEKNKRVPKSPILANEFFNLKKYSPAKRLKLDTKIAFEHNDKQKAAKFAKKLAALHIKCKNYHGIKKMIDEGILHPRTFLRAELSLGNYENFKQFVEQDLFGTRIYKDLAVEDELEVHIREKHDGKIYDLMIEGIATGENYKRALENIDAQERKELILGRSQTGGKEAEQIMLKLVA